MSPDAVACWNRAGKTEVRPGSSSTRGRSFTAVEELDDEDRDVVAHLGYALARAQLFEFGMTKLLEVQRHDLRVPLDERWHEIKKWLKLTAGQLRSELGLTSAISDDLRRLVDRRNQVVHQTWLAYQTSRGGTGGASAPADYVRWLEEQAELFGHAYNGLMALVEARRAHPSQAFADVAEATWREHVPEPLKPL